MKKRVMAVVIGAAALAGAVVWGQRRGPEKAAAPSAVKPGAAKPAGKASHPKLKAVVGVAKVIRTEDMESRHYTGQIVSKSVVQIVPRVSGEILEIGFQDGSVVKKGQMLYKLDSVEYEAAVKGAQARIAECKAKLEYAQSCYDRNTSLYAKQAASRDTLENTKSTLQVLKAQLLSAEADLIRAQEDLKYTCITAPIDGLAGVTGYTVGNYLTPASGALCTIIQVQPVRVRFSISTGDYLEMFGSVQELRKSGVVRLRLSDRKPYPVSGTVELLNNEANQKTDAIQVYAAFPNDDLKLLVGSTVGVTLSKKTGRMLPAAPPSAVMHDAAGSYVYVVDAHNRVAKRYFTPGNSTPELQMALSGLQEGETVVVEGTHKTMPGDEVQPLPAGK